MPPTDRSYTTSYWSTTLTIAVSCAMSTQLSISYFYRHDFAKRSHAGIVLLSTPKIGFSRVGGKFHIYRGRNVGIQPPNYKNFEFWPYIFLSEITRLHNFYEILRFNTRLKVTFKFLIWSLSGEKQPSYKHFPAVRAFSFKSSIDPSGETTDRIKKG